MNSTKLSDSRLLELVRAATKRDPEAVECLFVVLLPRVRNLVRYLTRGDPEVDDLSQDALVVIPRGLSTYRADGPFYAWADRVVARSVFRTLKQRRQSAVIPLDELKPCQLKPPSVEPEADFARRRQLVLALDQLPLEQRMTLVLRYVLGFSAKEIAREWDVPEETVRSRLRLEHLSDANGAADHYRAAASGQGQLGEEAAYGLAEAHRAAGRHDAERQQLHRFLDQYPTSPLAATARLRLRELERHER